MILSEQELNKLRNVSIHGMLGLTNDGRKVFVSCPLHIDKTPSLCIFPDGGFKCFSCGKYGFNSIDFLTNFCGLTFLEAIQELSVYR